jgi:protoporphyrinogen oxidase
MKVTILGAGLAGLSCSYHLGHENCILYEKNSYSGGHIASHSVDGCIWDEGPHISFTKNEYVRDLFAQSVEGDYLEYETSTGNWFQGTWIPHPAQSNLYAVPEPLAKKCLDDFLVARQAVNGTTDNYREWLELAFGKTFAKSFPIPYTRKYWTREPEDLTTEWIGQRIYYPDPETVKAGYKTPALKTTNYISRIRYPRVGGYQSFSRLFQIGADIRYGHSVSSINLAKRLISFQNGSHTSYDKLISTIPLNHFIALQEDVPPDVSMAANQLLCTSVLLVNITSTGPSLSNYHWLYVYDEDKQSVRITQNHLLSPENMMQDQVGIQVEVYSSRYRPFSDSYETISKRVIGEVVELGLVNSVVSYHWRLIPYANIVFDNSRRDAQTKVLEWLENFGLNRESDDLEPMTDWNNASDVAIGDIALAGRFGQWKYFWTDDCVLRGKQLRADLHNSS